MIEIGNKTKVVMGNGSNIVLSQLVDFYDLIGLNALYIHSDNEQPLKCNSIKSSTRYPWEKVEEKIMSNLFRLDLIIVASNIHVEKIVKLIDTQVKLPTIYLTSVKLPKVVVDDPHRLDAYDYGYLFYRKNNSLNFQSIINTDFDTDYYIKDLKNDWEDNLLNLKKSWNRDKRIDDLLK
jgi:hypothetical protein